MGVPDGRSVRRPGGITVWEFVDKVFDTFADVDQVYPAVIPALWEAVPPVAREEFEAVVRHAATPEVRYRAFHFGGERRLTEKDLERDAEVRTDRVRAWAEALVQWWDRPR